MEYIYVVSVEYIGKTENMHDAYYYKSEKSADLRFRSEVASWKEDSDYLESEPYKEVEEEGYYYCDISGTFCDMITIKVSKETLND